MFLGESQRPLGHVAQRVSFEVDDDDHAVEEQPDIGGAHGFGNHQIGLFDGLGLVGEWIETAGPHDDHLAALVVVFQQRQEAPLPKTIAISSVSAPRGSVTSWL